MQAHGWFPPKRIEPLRSFLAGMAIVFVAIKKMKTKAIVAGLVAVAAAGLTYYFVKNRKQKKKRHVQRTHHLTEIFAQAKAQAK